MKSLFASLALLASTACVFAAPAPPPVPNAHFAEVAAQLDEGGDLYAYLNLRPFTEWLGGLIDQGVTAAVQIASTEDPQAAAQITGIYGIVKRVAGQLGVDQLGDIGLSCRAVEGNLFRTRYVLAKRSPKDNGLIWKGTGPNRPGFPAIRLLPEDSVLAISSRPQLGEVWHGIKQILAGTPAQEPFQAGLADALNNGFDIDAILKSIGDEMAFAVTFDAQKTTEFPPPVGEIPAPGVMLALKLNDPTIPTLFTLLSAGNKEAVSRTNLNGVAATVLRPPNAPPFLAPCWAHHEGWLFLAHHPDALGKMLQLAAGKGRTLADNAEFKAYAAGMPKETVAMSFLSRRFMSIYMETITRIFTSDENAPPGMADMMKPLTALYGDQTSMLSVGEKTETGFRTTAHGPFNQSIGIAGLVVMVPAALTAAVVVPAFALRPSPPVALEDAPVEELAPMPEALAPPLVVEPEPAPEPAPEPEIVKPDNTPRGKCYANRLLLAEAVAAFESDEGRLPKTQFEVRKYFGGTILRCPSGGTYSLPRVSGGRVTCNVDGHAD